MKFGEAWKDPSNIIATVACILSAFSFLISVRSCRVADRSFELTVAEFQSQRSIILSGSVEKDNQSIAIRPADSSIALQEAKAIFPSEVNDQEWPIQPPEHRLYVVMLEYGLKKQIESRVKRVPGHISVALDANVPVVITSLYTAKGLNREDVSLYRIMYGFTLNGDTKESPKIEYKGLIFVQHLDKDVDKKQVLNDVWSKNMGRPNTPMETDAKDGRGSSARR